MISLLDYFVQGGDAPQPVRTTQPILSYGELQNMELAAAQAGDRGKVGRIREVMKGYAPQHTPQSQAVATGLAPTTTEKAQSLPGVVSRGRQSLLEALSTQP